MFVPFFENLRQANIPVSLREYLTFLETLSANIGSKKMEDFYYLARMSLVKDERHIDKFDQIFSQNFKGFEPPAEGEAVEVPEEWLRAVSEKFLTEEEKAQIKELGGWEKIMETLKERLEEQKGRHQGGNKWIGTGGTSPYGAYGYNPAGIRIGQHESRHRRAIKVWDKREFKDLDDTIEIGTRNIKMALRKLRQFARAGAQEELDMSGTIRATSEKGYLDVKMMPERHNAVKVLLFFDIGGSMDDHIAVCEELFSAARSEFKNMEYYYFHNCLYEQVWKTNKRRFSEKLETWDVLHTYPGDYKVIFVGDAAMSPYEIAYPGGSVEHMNPEPGQVWLERFLEKFPNTVWLNPEKEDYWDYTHSNQMMRQIFSDRMYPLTLEGLDKAITELMR